MAEAKKSRAAKKAPAAKRAASGAAGRAAVKKAPAKKMATRAAAAPKQKKQVLGQMLTASEVPAGTPPLLIVGNNIDRYHAYRASKADDLERICQGVYVNAGDEHEEIFGLYGMRIASYLLPQSSFSFATAWLRRPRMGRVFVTGAYQYARTLFGDKDRYMIVQSIGVVDPKNPLLHIKQVFSDPMGDFEMLVDTPEMTLLNMQTSTKRHSEKHLKGDDEAALIQHIVDKHGDRLGATLALQRVAMAADRMSEFERCIKAIFPTEDSDETKLLDMQTSKAAGSKAGPDKAEKQLIARLLEKHGDMGAVVEALDVAATRANKRAEFTRAITLVLAHPSIKSTG